MGSSTTFIDRTGLRYGLLTVVKRRRHRNGESHAVWRAKCDCGKSVYLASSNLTRAKSCGCLRAPHRQTCNGRTREYNCWVNMTQRCYNEDHPSYEHYGGRGITVSKRWRESFEAFFADMGKCADGLSLDRKNNDGNYHKRNCRWATKLEQVHNRRRYKRSPNKTKEAA